MARIITYKKNPWYFPVTHGKEPAMKKPLLFLPLLLFLSLLSAPLSAQAASFKITAYSKDIEVRPDGSAYITEAVTYAFDGAYNGFLATLHHEEGVSLSNLALSDESGNVFSEVGALRDIPYTHTVISTKDKTDIKAYSPGVNGTRVFNIEYRLDGYCQRHLDAARINKLIFDAENDYKQASFTVALPGNGWDDVQSFVHGTVPQSAVTLQQGRLATGPATQSALSLRPDRLSIGPVDLRKGDKVEVHLLFPAEWLPDAPIIQSDILEEALAVERRAAGEAEQRAADTAEATRALRVNFLALTPVYAVLSALAFFRQRKKYGLARPLPSVVDDAALDAIPPALAEVLCKRYVSSAGLSATLLDFTARGMLTMRSGEGDTCFARAEASFTTGLLPHQAFLLSWLFPEGREELWVSSLDAGEDYQAAQAFTKQYGQWKSAVRKDAADAGWIFVNGGKKALYATLSVVLGLSLSIAMLVFGIAWPVPVLCALLGILFCVLFTRLRRVTDEGETRLAALNGFVDSYIDKLETDPHSVSIHAPLIMALGFMETLAEWIDSHPDAFGQHAWPDPPIWMSAGWHHGACHMHGAIREVQHHNAHVQDPSQSGHSGGGSSGGSNAGSSHGAW